MERSKNVTLFNVFQCFKLSDEYMKLLSTYRCGSRDSVYRVKICVERHFAALDSPRVGCKPNRWCFIVFNRCVCACVHVYA